MSETLLLRVGTDDPGAIARLALSLVVPRPIGWVSTVAADGSRNLAPFSFFNLVASNPPVFVVAPSVRRGGDVKDTLANARATGDIVAHIVDEALAEPMNQTSAEVAHGVDEFDLAGLATAPSTVVRPPRIAAAPIALEARVDQIVAISGTSYHLIIGRVVVLHVRRDLIGPDGLVDPERLRPVARLGGELYTTLGRVFAMKRPV